MQESSSRSPSPGDLEQRNHAEAAQKTTYMWSDGGTQTKDIRRMDQEVWMGYNYVNPAVNLTGCGTGGKSPALQGVRVSPLFPGGFTQMPFCPATPAIPKTGRGTVRGFYSRANLPHGSIWSPLGLPWPFHGTPRLWVSVVRLFQSWSESEWYTKTLCKLYSNSHWYETKARGWQRKWDWGWSGWQRHSSPAGWTWGFRICRVWSISPGKG